MAKQQISEDQAHKKNRPKIESARPDLTHGSADPGQLSDDSVFMAGNGSLHGQAVRLSDPRLQNVQRQVMAAHIGQVQGNQHLQQLMAHRQGQANGQLQLGRPLVQRQDDAGVSPPGPAPATPRPTFTQAGFSQQGSRFDSSYTPAGPAPVIGTLDINLWVHITYAPFTRAMMRQEPYRSHRFTREQLADFTWKDEEKEKFETDFMSSVMGAWSGQHMLHLNDPNFAEYRCRVAVNVMTISDPSQAHTKITAQKIPKDAPRFRSFVSGDTATLDIRDPSEPETHGVHSRKMVRQIKPFELGSAGLTPTLEAQIGEVEGELRRLAVTPGPDASGGDWEAVFAGRASSSGSRGFNKQLGLRRAETVKQRMAADMGWSSGMRVVSAGEEHATDDEAFQRVDISVRDKNRTNVTQNVAAHEAGHMFGLGDEYVEEAPGPDGGVPKFFGDEPEHYGDVQTHLGTDTANELLVQDSGSMMSSGGQVKRGHYVYFLEAIKQMTGKNWTVE